MKKIKTDNMYRILLILIFVILRAVINMYFYPITRVTGYDEYGTIAWPAHILGSDWSDITRLMGFYGFGYSMLMLPLFLIIKDFVVLYRAMLLCNGICLGIAAVCCFNILRKYLSISDPKKAALISLVAIGTFPSLYYSNTVYNENALLALVWGVLYVLISMSDADKREKIWKTVLLFVLLAYSLTVHTRALFLWGVVLICIILYGIVYKRCIVHIPSMLIAGGGSYVLISLLLKYMQGIMWVGKDSDAVKNTVQSSVGKLEKIRMLFTAKGIESMFGQISGQLFALSVVTCGLGIIFSVVYIVALKKHLFRNKKGKGTSELWDAGYFLVSTYGFFLLYSIMLMQMINKLNKSDGYVVYDTRWYLYMRYWSPACGIILLCAIIYMLNKKINISHWIAAGVIYAASTGFFLWKIVPLLSGIEIKRNSSSIYTKYMGLFLLKMGSKLSFKHVFAGVAIIAVLMLIIFALYIKKKIYCIAAVVILYSVYMFGYATFFHETTVSRESYEIAEDILEAMEYKDSDTNIVYMPKSFTAETTWLARELQILDYGYTVSFDIKSDMKHIYAVSDYELEGLTAEEIFETESYGNFYLYKIR